jgi:hypothetical protein
VKNMLVLAAFGGLTMSAAAQSLEVSITFDDELILGGQVTTARMTARMVGFNPGAYFSLVNVNLLAVPVTQDGNPNERFAASPGTGLGWAFPILGEIDPGTPNGGDLLGVFAAQQALFGAVNTANPFVVMSWNVTQVAQGYTAYTLGAIANTPGMFAVTDPAGNPFAPPIYFSLGDENFQFHSQSTGFVTTPGGVLVLAAGGVAMGRRRR